MLKNKHIIAFFIGLLLFILSQVVLAGQLSFAIVPLIHFTSDKKKMGPFVNGVWTKTLGWGLAAVIAGLNIYMICAQIALSR